MQFGEVLAIVFHSIVPFANSILDSSQSIEIVLVLYYNQQQQHQQKEEIR